MTKSSKLNLVIDTTTINANAHFIVTHDKHFNVLRDITFPRLNVIDIHQLKQLLTDFA